MLIRYSSNEVFQRVIMLRNGAIIAMAVISALFFI